MAVALVLALGGAFALAWGPNCTLALDLDGALYGTVLGKGTGVLSSITPARSASKSQVSLAQGAADDDVFFDLGMPTSALGKLQENE